jgi:glutathione S-transferase
LETGDTGKGKRDMLKILGRNTSSNVQKVLWCCDEIGIPFEREDVGGPFGKNREPEYLAMNPNGLVPTVIDDGFTMWESNSIVRYLAAKSESPLYPADLQQRSLMERWMDFELSKVSRFMVTVFIGLTRTPPEERDHDAINAAIASWTDAMLIMDRHLANQDYLGGSAFSIADIPLGPITYRWLNMGFERPAAPNVEAWYQRLGERAAYREHVMIPLG